MSLSRLPGRPPPVGAATANIPRWVAAITASVLALAGLVAPRTPVTAAAATPPAGPVPHSATGDAGRTWTVTLITGDRIHLTHHGGDSYTANAERPHRPDGSVPTMSVTSSPDGILAIPDDAQQAVDAGILDRALFDVKYLALNGYADDATTQTPTIMQYQPGIAASAAFTTAEALPASDATISLASLNGAAVKVDKDKAGEYWSRLHATMTGSRPTALTGGLSRIWLDRKVEATLAESVPLIGAPQAWQAGLDGKGTTVAVLDTGVDANHPDLAGKVATSASFIEGQTVADGHGHGTHVAATVAGTGAASAASRKGVAPGANLAIGKVLDNTGTGWDSTVIAGMEWAAKTVGAKVVSMSLGAGPTDGKDPQSQVVNRLSAETGTLFVIAAGNGGAGPETVNSPGTADAALTVAATSKTDAMAGFSSRGPRRDDGGLKPDIAAPGVGIIAARAAGTALGTPVDANYTSLNGTSMATPHVAGAAAILAQAHPDWTGARLKAALMSTAKDAGHTVYEQGAGRVDVARAAAQAVVTTTAGVGFGKVPHDDNAPVTRDVTYANSGAAEVTLSLSASLRTTGGNPTEGALSAPGSVTVPAGGTATVTVTLNPTGLAKGTYTGALVAADTASGTRVTTPIGLTRDVRKVKLRIRTLGFDGGPMNTVYEGAGTWVSAIDVPDESFQGDSTFVGTNIVEYRVQPGHYAVFQKYKDLTDSANELNAQMVAPEVEVTGDTEITMDASRTVPIRFNTPKPMDRANLIWTMGFDRSVWNGRLAGLGIVGWTPVTHFATPTAAVTKGSFNFKPGLAVSNPRVRMTITHPTRMELTPYQAASADEGSSLNANRPVFPAGKQELEPTSFS